MRERFLDLLRCPACGGKVSLSTSERQDDDIITGTLVCSSCATTYPIKEGIPYMMTGE